MFAVDFTVYIIHHWLFDSFIAIITGLIVLVVYYFSMNNKWRKLNVPHPQLWTLFKGTFKVIFGLVHWKDTYHYIYKHFPDKKFCGFYQLRTPYLMIRDPELINRILIKDFEYFTDHGVHSDPSINLLARGLFFLNGQRWRAMRQKLSPGFTSCKLKLMHGQIKECCDQLMYFINEKSKTTDQFNVNDVLSKFSTEVIGTCAFGLKLDSIKDDDSAFRKYVKELFRPSIRILVSQILEMISPKISKVIKVKQFSTEAIDFYNSAFSEIIKYRETNNVYRNDVAQILMHARKELVLNDDLAPEERFTQTDINANALLMVIGGSEPVSTTLAFCLHELAINKHIQDKLRKHIFEIKEKHNGNFNNDYLMNLHYADMIITETLRKCSGLGILLREATRDYQIPGESLVIEKGQKLIIPSYSIHNDPKYYPNPKIFDPERFSPEERAKRPSGTELSFGDGPRICLGKRFAEIEMKLALSEIISRFEVLPCKKTEIPIKLHNTGVGLIIPKNGIWISMKKLIDSTDRRVDN